MATGKGLGKGLNLIFNAGMTEQEVSGENPVKSIRISEIEPNPGQPRHNFDQISLEELAQSIRENGVITPLTLRKNGDKYQIIAGERRWRASRLAGLKEVPAHVIEADDRTAFALGLIENLQRQDLDPMEEAAGYKTLMEEYGMTQEQAAERVGKSRPAVANALRLLQLPEHIAALVSDRELSAGHGRAVLSLKDPVKQDKLVQLILQDNLSVREAEKLAAQLQKESPEKVKAPKDIYVAQLEKDMTGFTGHKITISQKPKKGKLTIEYYGNQDLEAICEALKKIKN